MRGLERSQVIKYVSNFIRNTSDQKLLFFLTVALVFLPIIASLGLLIWRILGNTPSDRYAELIQKLFTEGTFFLGAATMQCTALIGSQLQNSDISQDENERKEKRRATIAHVITAFVCIVASIWVYLGYQPMTFLQTLLTTLVAMIAIICTWSLMLTTTLN